MADVAALEAQVKDAGEAVRLMKEANKTAPGTHSKVHQCVRAVQRSRPARVLFLRSLVDGGYYEKESHRVRLWHATAPYARMLMCRCAGVRRRATGHPSAPRNGDDYDSHDDSRALLLLRADMPGSN